MDDVVYKCVMGYCSEPATHFYASGNEVLCYCEKCNYHIRNSTWITALTRKEFEETIAAQVMED
jgi:hypothetical protein